MQRTSERARIERAGIHAEEAFLFDGLRSAAATKALRTICGDEDEGEALVVGLDSGGKQLGGGGAAGGDDGHGLAIHENAAEGKKGGAAFLEEVPELHAGAVR
jgi:hypothetical protein